MKFMTPQEFSKEVELEIMKRSCTTIEAILFLCEKYQQEPEDIKGMLTEPLIERLRGDAIDMNLVKKSNTSSLDILFT